MKKKTKNIIKKRRKKFDLRKAVDKFLTVLSRKGNIKNVYIFNFIVIFAGVNWWVMALLFSGSDFAKIIVSLIFVQVIAITGLITYGASKK